jgi:hypothetical protein
MIQGRKEQIEAANAKFLGIPQEVEVKDNWVKVGDVTNQAK